MSLSSSHSLLESSNGLTIEVSGLCYDDVDGTPCGFDKMIVGPFLFYSMEEAERVLSLDAFSGVWSELVKEARRIRAEDRKALRELREWLDKRRNG